MTTLDDLAAAAEKAKAGPYILDASGNWTSPMAEFVAVCSPTTVLRLVAVARAAQDVDALYDGYWPFEQSEVGRNLRAALAALEEVR